MSSGTAPVTPSPGSQDGPSLAESTVSVLPLAIVAAIAITCAVLLGSQIWTILDTISAAIPLG